MLNAPNLSLASKLSKLFVLSVAICRTLNNYTWLNTVQAQLRVSKTVECQVLQNSKLAKIASVLHLESLFSWLTCLRKNNLCSCSLYQHSQRASILFYFKSTTRNESYVLEVATKTNVS